MIGSLVRGWKVLEKADSDSKYNYRYKCVCPECGNKRDFLKYHLKAGQVAECEVCKSNETARNNYEEFIKCYKPEENAGIVIDNIDNVDYDKIYRLICPEGHTFKATILNYKGCIKCQGIQVTEVNIEALREQIESDADKLYDYIGDRLQEEFSEVISGEEYPIGININGEVKVICPDLIVNDFNLSVEILSKADYNYIKGVHSSREEFVKRLFLIKKRRERLEDLGYISWTVNSTGNFDKDVDKFEKTLAKILG